MVVSAVAATCLGAGSAVATAAGSGAGGATVTAEGALRLQAEQLASQIQAEGVNLDQIAEQVDAAQLHNQQLNAQLSILKAGMVRTAGQVKVAKANLKRQALLSYLAGGAPTVAQLPGRPGLDRSLTVSYAEIASGGLGRAVDAYRAVLASQTQQAKQVTEADRQVLVSLSKLQADRAAAMEAVAVQRQTLAQVQGRLATLVAQVEEAQQQAEQAAVRATLAREDQLPPSTPAVQPVRASGTSSQAVSRPAPAAPVSSAGSPSSPAYRAAAPQPTAPPTTTRPAPPTASPPVAEPPAPTPPPATLPPVTSPPVTSPPTTSPPVTAPPPPPPGNYEAPGAGIAVSYAYAQLGKPYQWGGAGPGSFDCSGLTMRAWDAAGVYFPHLAQAQYDLTMRIPLADALPGDLIFFGTSGDVYHVGIYIGGGEMIDAPSTGLTVSISSIYWSDLLGAGRV